MATTGRFFKVRNAWVRLDAVTTLNDPHMNARTVDWGRSGARSGGNGGLPG
jgi:hypothetical protein